MTYIGWALVNVLLSSFQIGYGFENGNKLYWIISGCWNLLLALLYSLVYQIAYLYQYHYDSELRKLFNEKVADYYNGKMQFAEFKNYLIFNIWSNQNSIQNRKLKEILNLVKLNIVEVDNKAKTEEEFKVRLAELYKNV